MSIGVVGLGKMGMAIARRLGEQGRTVIGWDVDPSRIAQAVETGIVGASDPADLADRSQAVLSIVTDDAAVRWLFDGPRGLLSGTPRGRLFVEMSTVKPSTIRAIGAAAEQAGADLVGCPVIGSIPSVRDGQLIGLAGGMPEAIARTRTVLSGIAGDVVDLGPLGAGNAMKLAVNLTMAAYVEALAEGLALGERQGLRLDQMLAMFGRAPTANPWLKAKLPTLMGNPAAMTLDLASLHKDVLSAVATGSEDGLAMPLASGVLSSLTAAVAANYGAADLAQLPDFFRRHMVRRGPTRTNDTADR